MKLLTKCTTLMLVAFLAGCSEETQHAGGNQPEPGGTDDAGHREVLLTLKNKLALKQVATKAETIATADENAIETLDVYVFASESEAGDNYTLLQRFAYRAEAEATLPVGAEELQLAVDGDNGETTTGLLKVKKGLFVKLYCIANNTMLVDPASGDGTPLTDAAFTPLVLSEADGNNPTKIVAPGQPSESIFKTYHTALLSATVPGDTLCTPLAMSGAQTTPLDLTDFGSSARVQAGFKLTRLAARFDIVNNAETSRFTIQSVSMGNGRRGATFFPIRIYGTVPEAATGELITCPSRTFSGEKANKGMQIGAFYSYPSPKNDHGFLTLKGLYRINKTESKEVSYQIPFTQQGADGSSSFLEINNNHRYTIGITEADDYHLDFTLTVADWADDGSIDEYKPEDGSGELNVTIPPAFDGDTQYDPDTRVVSMSLKENSTIDVNISTNSALTIQKTYVGGLEAQQYDWLDISEPTTKAAVKDYSYAFAVKDGYTGGRYPRVVVRFTNIMDGSESILFVEAIAAPQIDETMQDTENHNKLDVIKKTVSMYRANKSSILINVTSPDGSTIKSQPEWLDMEVVANNASVTTYKFTLKDSYRDTEIAGNKGSVIFQNSKQKDLETEITFNLLDAKIIAENKSVTAANSGSISIPVKSPFGVTAKVYSWGSGSQWFSITTNSLDGNGSIVITQLDNSSTIMKPATIRLTNKLTGAPTDKDIIITPIFSISLSETSKRLENLLNDNKATTKTNFTVTSAGGFSYSVISGSGYISTSQSNNTITVTAKKQGTATIRITNKSNTSVTKDYTVTVARDYEGQAVWKSYKGNYYIAPKNATESTNWGPNLTSSFCANKSGSSWRAPSQDDIKGFLGTTSTYQATDQATYNFYKNNGVFKVGDYVSATVVDDIGCFFMGFTTNKASLDANLKTTPRMLRCVTN